jgi:hypothetical protein
VRRVTFDRRDGDKRQLGIPNVIDRLIQQTIVQVLTPLFDPGFSASSHTFDRNALRTEQPSKFGERFASTTTSSWTWTFQNSLIMSSTMF